MRTGNNMLFLKPDANVGQNKLGLTFEHGRINTGEKTMWARFFNSKPERQKPRSEPAKNKIDALGTEFERSIRDASTRYIGPGRDSPFLPLHIDPLVELEIRYKEKQESIKKFFPKIVKCLKEAAKQNPGAAFQFNVQSDRVEVISGVFEAELQFNGESMRGYLRERDLGKDYREYTKTSTVKALHEITDAMANWKGPSEAKGTVKSEA